jgi:MinD-like ATPase involved in chromosome partitioning or flagellar assembly
MISVTSGKGGVGKTFFSINLALQLYQKGFRPCLFDADLGLSNIDVMLGLNPAHNLMDLFDKKLSLRDIMLKNHQGIDIIPGGSGIEQLTQLSPASMEYLIHSFSELDQYDFLIFDTAAGISKNVLSFCLSCSELIIIITPEPTSITDAYALLKVLTLNGLRAEVMVVFNQIKKVATAKKAYKLFEEAVMKHLNFKIRPLGFIFQDPRIQEAIKERQAFLSMYPNSKTAICFRQIADNLIKMNADTHIHIDMESFWKSYLQSVQKQHFILDPAEKLPAKDKNMEFFDVTKGVDLDENQPQSGGNELKQTAAVQLQDNHLDPVTAVNKKESPPDTKPQTNPVIDNQLNNLIDAVRTLTDELKRIRKVLEKNLTQKFISNKKP